MNQAITSLACFQAREGAGEELGLRLHKLLLQARRDEGCLSCELLRDPRSADGWQLLGRWDSESALDAHLQLPHMQLLGQWVENGLIRRMEMCVDVYSGGCAS